MRFEVSELFSISLFYQSKSFSVGTWSLKFDHNSDRSAEVEIAINLSRMSKEGKSDIGEDP